MKVSFLILIFALTVANGQRISFGQCPQFPIKQNFDIQRYLGRWYEYSNYFAFFQLFGKCVSATYSDQTTRSGDVIVGVLNESINERNGRRNSVSGTAVLANPTDPLRRARLIVNFDSQPFFVRSSSANYNVVETDYDTFAIVYSCSDLAFFKSGEGLFIFCHFSQAQIPYDGKCEDYESD